MKFLESLDPAAIYHKFRGLYMIFSLFLHVRPAWL